MANDRIRVGDRDLEIQSFSGFKFLEATELLSRMLEIVPELDQDLAAFAKTWRDQNPIREVDRATAEMELGTRASLISEDAWQATGGILKLTPQPDGIQAAIRIVPKLQRHARGDFENLVALVVTPNSELEQADEAGDDLYEGNGPVAKQRRYVLHNGKPTQIIKLVIGAISALADEIKEGDLASAVGNLMTTVQEVMGKTESGDNPNPKPQGKRGSASGGRGSSTSSSRRTRADSLAGTSSTESPTAS